MATYRDWIPEGEDTGAQGNGGFNDFVQTKEPTFVPEPEQPKTEEKPIEKKKKK